MILAAVRPEIPPPSTMFSLLKRIACYLTNIEVMYSIRCRTRAVRQPDQNRADHGSKALSTCEVKLCLFGCGDALHRPARL